MSRAPARIGRYEPISLLATGGMGRVFLARSVGPGGFARHVVVKLLEFAEGEQGHDVKAMFLDEARILGLLHHQHIAPVFEVGDHEGQLYLVLDYVHGHNAQTVWDRAHEIGAALPLDFTLTVIAGAAAGLHHAHTRHDANQSPLGIVHRDVSPSNIMVGFDGAVKLIDFGIAMAANRTQKTQVGFVKGKLGYMAPEQVRGGDIDPRTDVFCLGTVLYELTTMRRAFREDSDRMTVERIKSGAFVKPSQIVPEYPKELERVVGKALKVDPRERFQDAESLRKAVEALGHRYELVLGDAAIAEIMHQLFDDAREPWLLESKLEKEPEPPRPEPPAAPSFKKKFRSATEAVFALGADDAPETTTPQAQRFASEGDTNAAARAYPGSLPPAVAAAAVDPPDRVSKIQRLFTQSSFDPTETPQRPIELPDEPRPPPSDPIPARHTTNRGVGVDTDGVEILPPAAQRAVGVDTDGVEILPAQKPAVAFKPPEAKPTGGGSGKRIALIAGGVILLGVAGIVIYTLTRGGSPVVVEADATVVHASPDAADSDAAPAAVDAVVVDAAPVDTASDHAPIDAAPIDSARVDAAVDAARRDAAVDSARAIDPRNDAGVAVDAAPRPDAPPRVDAGIKPVDAGGATHSIRLNITTTPPGATVEVDGKRLGKTPFEGSIDVTGGNHVLKLRRSGYTPIKTDIDLSGGEFSHEYTMNRTKIEPDGSGSDEAKPPSE